MCFAEGEDKSVISFEGNTPIMYVCMYFMFHKAKQSVARKRELKVLGWLLSGLASIPVYTHIYP